jgi:hypothetical protein
MYRSGRQEPLLIDRSGNSGELPNSQMFSGSWLDPNDSYVQYRHCVHYWDLWPEGFAMARLARADVFDPSEVSILRCINRCAVVLFSGEDPLTGKNYEHRKAWLEKRLEFLAGQFGISVLEFRSCRTILTWYSHRPRISCIGFRGASVVAAPRIDANRIVRLSIISGLAMPSIRRGSGLQLIVVQATAGGCGSSHDERHW